MKIPDDVKIVFNEYADAAARERFDGRVRDIPDTLWFNSKGDFRLYYNDYYNVAGHFTRTIKTRRVAWDLPEGFEIPADAKAMLEKTILAITDWHGNHYTPVGWAICAYAGGHGSARHDPFQFSMQFHITESTEELPWSPFEVQK